MISARDLLSGNTRTFLEFSKKKCKVFPGVLPYSGNAQLFFVLSGPPKKDLSIPDSQRRIYSNIPCL